ncbi:MULTISPECIES: glutathione S-transferase family protein [unclassified Paludibacterium]|uniref:glutathione S-transferase family protein n=1 Tax=unclassified Paludibacterium TaxID=2618429 RepID=UPI001C04B8B6|nr:glutathione S-transferase family protein [Paludibacterium sp. B53371]BEV72527.1 glutathione S-transferase [Paludibacterium sp. THUN1379]
MIKLYGAPLSPYYNKVRIALLEKGVKFEEILQRPSQDAEVLACSPLGKIPYVEIGQFHLSESTAIIEWLEDAYPTASLLPPTPNSRALSRQLMQLIDLDLIQGCAPFQRHKVFGAPLDEQARSDARAKIIRTLAGMARIAVFAPFLAGDTFSYADLSAAAVLPGVKLASDMLGEDLLQHLPGAETYLAQLAKRQTVTTTWAARDKALAYLLEQAANK